MFALNLVPRPREAQGQLDLPNLEVEGLQHMLDRDDKRDCDNTLNAIEEAPLLRRTASHPSLTLTGHRDAVDPEDSSVIIPTPRTPQSAPISRTQTPFCVDEDQTSALNSPGPTEYGPDQHLDPTPPPMLSAPSELHQTTAQQYLTPSSPPPPPGTPIVEAPFNPLEREIMDEITLHILAFRGYTPAPDVAVITNYNGSFVNAMVVGLVPNYDPPTTSPPENFVLHSGPPAGDRETALRGLLTALEKTAERPERLSNRYRVRPASIRGTEEIERKGMLEGPSFAEMRQPVEEMERAQEITKQKLQHA